MNFVLPPPPKYQVSATEWEQYWEKVYKRIRGNPTSSGDADAVIPMTSSYHAVTALSAARELTLPPAKDLLDGDSITIQDESGDAGTHTITVAPDGTDTISGTDEITADFGRLTVIKRGDGKWYGA